MALLSNGIPLPVACTCGALRGTYLAVPLRGARGVCYCDDCQAWAAHLDRDDVLDAHGGTEVVQSWPAQLSFTEGVARLGLGRLSAKGLHRWYATCCRTPVANTFGSPRWPFVGVLRSGLAVDDARLDGIYGPAHRVQGRFARGGCPSDTHRSATLGIVARAIGILLRGVLAGGNRPTPFFDPRGRTVVRATVLGETERAALRARVARGMLAP